MQNPALELIVRTHGTPAYVLDLGRVQKNIATIKRAITYENFQIHYAMFCNDNPALLQFLKEHGLGVLALNEQEVDRALNQGFRKDQVHITGGTFSRQNLKEISSRGIDLNVDSSRQLEMYGIIRPGSSVGIRIRVFDDGYAGIGEGIRVEEMPRVLAIAETHKLCINGLQTYVGTNTLDIERYEKALKSLMHASVLFAGLRYINIGGGFGIPYADADKAFAWDEFGQRASSILKSLHRPELQLKMEPGRSIVGNAGYFLTTVLEKRDEATLVVDAPYTAFARPFVYHTNMRVKELGANPGGPVETFKIRGCSINSNDYLSRPDFSGDCAVLPTNIQEGAVLCFLDAGAYSPVMQMDFLSYGKAHTILMEP